MREPPSGPARCFPRQKSVPLVSPPHDCQSPPRHGLLPLTQTFRGLRRPKGYKSLRLQNFGKDTVAFKANKLNKTLGRKCAAPAPGRSSRLLWRFGDRDAGAQRSPRVFMASSPASGAHEKHAPRGRRRARRTGAEKAHAGGQVWQWTEVRPPSGVGVEDRSKSCDPG